MEFSCCCMRSRVCSVSCAMAGAAAIANARGAKENSLFIRYILVFGWVLNAELAGNALQSITDVLDLAADVVQLIGTFHHRLGVAMHIAHMAGDFAESGALLIGGSGNLLVQLADLLNVFKDLAQDFAGLSRGINALTGHFHAALHRRNGVA